MNKRNGLQRELRSAVLSRRWSNPEATALCVLALLSAALASCAAPAMPQAADNQAGGASPLATPSIDKVLRSDARFSDFVKVIDFAGLSHELAGSHNVTVFAPTNAAFTHSDPNWRAWAMPQTNKDSSESHAARQKLVEAAGIRGIHPPSEFVGKLQDVQSIGGTVFHVDGRTPGVITISSGGVATGRMGTPDVAEVVAQLQMPPLQAVGGLIYAANAIVVPIPGAQ